VSHHGEQEVNDPGPRRSDAIASDDLAQKFKTEKDTPYQRWVRSERLDLIDARYVRNLRTVELKSWVRRGGRGVFLNHDASRTTNDCYICEIPPAGKLAPHRQMYEEMVFILDGRGSTTVWNHAGQRVTFEWQAGAIFGIPINCWHQHFNGSGQAPVRYVAVTNAPSVINLFADLEFIFGQEHDFKSRFSGEPDYFATGKELEGCKLTTNFIPDALNLPLPRADVRGAGGGHIRFNLAKASLDAHISQFPVATYKKAHAHAAGAHVIILSGEGYSLLWHDLNGEPIVTTGRSAPCWCRRMASTISISIQVPPRRAISPSSTAAQRVTRRVSCCASSATGSAVNSSTMPTKPRGSARCSPKRSPGTT
jgi:hypothetical protein